MEIELKTALFYDFEDTCDWCDEVIPAAAEHPYGNRATLEISGSPFNVTLRLCADCLTALIDHAKRALERMKHEHTYVHTEEYGELCKDCGQAKYVAARAASPSSVKE